MSIFRRPDYQSDATQFINKLKQERPELDAEQQAGRGLLWDRDIDRNLQAQYNAGRVRQQPYVYQTRPQP